MVIDEWAIGMITISLLNYKGSNLWLRCLKIHRTMISQGNFYLFPKVSWCFFFKFISVSNVIAPSGQVFPGIQLLVPKSSNHPFFRGGSCCYSFSEGSIFGSPRKKTYDLKMNDWKTTFLSFWGKRSYFQGAFAVSFRECFPKAMMKVELHRNPGMLACGKCRSTNLLVMIASWGEVVRYVRSKVCMIQWKDAILWGVAFAIKSWK